MCYVVDAQVNVCASHHPQRKSTNKEKPLLPK